LNAAPRTSLEGRYRILFQLGEGGAARVLLAAERGPARTFGQLVVLKYLRPELAADEEMRAAFLREALLMARMNHPNVVQLIDVDDDPIAPAIVMEYLEGQPLSVLRQGPRQLPRDLALLVVVDALTGLEYFHGIKGPDGVPLHPVHRDLSPHNTFVTYDGTVKVLDFGIARVSDPRWQGKTRTGMIKGKLRYMAPEQLLGEAVDARTDLFAAGIMLWEAVVGRPLWSGAEADVIRGLISGAWLPSRAAAPDAPEALHAVIDSALRVHPAERAGSARELRESLVRAMSAIGATPSHAELAAFMNDAFGEELVTLRQRVDDGMRAARDGWFWSPASMSGRPASPAAVAGRRLSVALAAAALVGTGLGARWLAAGWRAPAVAGSAARVAEGAPAAGGAPCASPNLIADFEDGTANVCTSGARGGRSTLYFDGTGTVLPVPGILTASDALPEPRGSSKRGLHVVGHGQHDYGVGIAMALARGAPIDVSAFDGVMGWFSSSRALTIDIKLATVDTMSSAYGGACEPTPKANCDDHYGLRRVIGPHWTFLRVPIKGMTQLDQGVRVRFDPTKVVELHIRIPRLAEDPPLDFELWVDDLAFY
jgi:hypothetical protein